MSVEINEDNKLAGMSILVAEDVEVSRVLLAEFLRFYGADVYCAENGKEAVDSYLAKHFDVVLMDIQMPIMDGVEATKCIRECSSTCPVVAVTAAPEEEAQMYLNQGFSAVFHKPVDTRLLYELIQTLH